MINLFSIICQKEKLIRAHCKYANVPIMLRRYDRRKIHGLDYNSTILTYISTVKEKVTFDTP